MKKLFEFTALLECAYVVAADDEKSAREAIKTYEKTWFTSGDFLGVQDVQLSDVRDADQDCLNDLAHEIT